MVNENSWNSVLPASRRCSWNSFDNLSDPDFPSVKFCAKIVFFNSSNVRKRCIEKFFQQFLDNGSMCCDKRFQPLAMIVCRRKEFSASVDKIFTPSCC